MRERGNGGSGGSGSGGDSGGDSGGGSGGGSGGRQARCARHNSDGDERPEQRMAEVVVPAHMRLRFAALVAAEGDNSAKRKRALQIDGGCGCGVHSSNVSGGGGGSRNWYSQRALIEAR